MSHLRIWFVTDIHGSSACFRKFLNLHKQELKPNVVIIGGDITGKKIVPIIPIPHERYKVPKNSGNKILPKADLKDYTKNLEDSGYYPLICSETEYKKVISNTKYQSEVLDRLTKQRLEEWVELADKKLLNVEDCIHVINSGNDDDFYVDEILDKSKTLIRAEGKIIDLPSGYKLISTGYSNKTPWDCPRDLEEESLKDKIFEMLRKINSFKPEKMIFNFHCPPYNTPLDKAIALNDQMIPIPGKTEHVGSSSVLEIIKEWEPILSLHGHIHEVNRGYTKIKNTISLNPGSDYNFGKLRGVFIRFSDDGTPIFKWTEEQLPIGGSSKRNIWENLPFIGWIFKSLKKEEKN